MMVYYMNLISLVIAVSLDGFGVGITYGMWKIRISLVSLLVIMFCSGIIVITSMMIGQLLRHFISPAFTSALGSFILIALGLFVLLSIIRSKKMRHKKTMNNNKLIHLKTIMSSPQKADKDKSGNISVSEALILGTALALDAFGAGLGAAMLGYSPILTSILIASMSGLFIYSGITIGLLLAKNKILQNFTYLPPLILISIGIYHLF